MSDDHPTPPRYEYRTAAQIRAGAIHYLDFRGLTKEEAEEASENIHRLMSRPRVTETTP